MSHKRRSAAAAALAAVAILVAFAACSKKDSPVAPVVSTPTVEDPTAVVKRFRDAWVHRDTTALAATLDAFIGYGTACVDSNGNVFLGAGLDVDSVELAAARLFKLGSASHPPAVSIDVDLGPMEVETGIADSIYERGVFCSPRVVIRTATDTLHLGGFTGFLLVRPHGPAAVPADTTGWHILTWVEIATSEPPVTSLRLAGMRPVLRAALQQAAAKARGGPGASAECDSLLRALWGYSLQRYLE
jgi:hypothetical protein